MVIWFGECDYFPGKSESTSVVVVVEESDEMSLVVSKVETLPWSLGLREDICSGPMTQVKVYGSLGFITTGEGEEFLNFFSP